MRDPCRICGVRAVGSQCRWIFSSSAKTKLHVILSHVLGWEVTRDGRGEFLCGKCVFQLEKVVQCDVDISQLQDEHSTQIQKLQAEKEHLIHCIVHTYNKNNSSLERSDGENFDRTTPLRFSAMGSLDDDTICQQTFEVQQLKGSYMKRCVSLDHIATKGAYGGRSGSMKSSGLRGMRHRSQSMYLDLVQRKGMLLRPGFKGRCTSLQSLNRDFLSDIPPDPPAKLKLRESKAFVNRQRPVNEKQGMIETKALLRSSLSKPSVISDLIQLLRCISMQKVSVPEGSHIPVLKRLNTGTRYSRSKHRDREAVWKSLHDLTEEFNDEYAPVRVKVVFCNASLVKTFYSVCEM